MSDKPTKKPGIVKSKSVRRGKYSPVASQSAGLPMQIERAASHANLSGIDLANAMTPVLATMEAQETKIKAQALKIAALEKGLAQMTANQKAQGNTYHIPQSLAELKPRRLPPPGKTAMEMIQGQWPGEETTEELLAQLKALD